MTIKNDINFTYHGYLQNLHYKNDAVDKEYIQQLLGQFKQLAVLPVLLPNAPILFAIDYSKSQYLFFSNPLGNHHAEQILEGGLAFTIPLMDPDFFNTFNEEVFPATLSFLKNIKPEQDVEYITSFNYKIKNTDKSEVTIYQSCLYTTCKDSGLPTHCVGMAIDISHVKNDNEITLLFEKRNKHTGFTTLVEKNCFYPYREEALFTPQEKAVLQYITDGLSSKMMADKLALSLKTIESHRYNILRKTNTKNVAELIMFVVRNKIL